MVKLSDKSMARKKAYDVQYAKDNFKCKNVAFNMKNPEDKAIFDWIKLQPEGGNKYMKRLVLEDMERRQNV